MLVSLFRPDIFLSILLTFKPIMRGLLACLPATLLILTDPLIFSGEGAFLLKWPLFLDRCEELFAACINFLFFSLRLT